MGFLEHFQQNNQTLENIFQSIFWNATKHLKIFSFSKNSDLKIKIEGTSGSTPCTISKNEKETISDEHTDFDTISSIPAKEILNDEVPRFVENSKITQNWYSESIPPDIQFKKRIFQPQFPV